MNNQDPQLALEEIVERFQSEWSSGDPPSISQYLPTEEPLRSYVLAALALTDLELKIRARGGEGFDRSTSLAAGYLETYPSLTLSQVYVLELFSKEYSFRQRYEPQLLWTDFLALVPEEYQEELIPSLRFILKERKDGGQGAFGEVWLSIDQQLGREVALKVLKPGRLTGEERKRFVYEAKVTSRLEHPNIVPVYGIEETADGRPAYAMRFIEWPTLSHQIAEHHSRNDSFNNNSFRKLVTQFRDVCQAVAYAHEHNYLHLDIKPDNIQVGDFGETMLLDWGLARASQQSGDEPPPTPRLPPQDADAAISTYVPDQSVRLATGDVLGTPSYMSPEQAQRALRPTDDSPLNPASDIYGLGATLYQILTDRTPYDSRSDAEGTRTVNDLFQQIFSGDFDRPATLDTRVPKALDAICAKAMAKDPRDRYESTAHLAQDIENWLADEPVSAYPEPVIEKLRRRVKKNFTVVAAAAAGAMGVLAMLLVLYVVLNIKNAELTELNDAVNQKNVELKQLNAEARKNERLAIESLTLMVDAVSKDLRPVPEAVKVRKKLLRQANEQLEKISVRHTGESEDERLLMVLYNAQAGMKIEFADGDVNRREETLQLLLKSHDIANKLAKDPGRLEDKINLMRSSHAVGDFLRRANGEKSHAHLIEAERLGARLAAAHAGNVDVCIHYSRLLSRLADFSWRVRKKPALSVEYSEKNMDLVQKTIRMNPGNEKLQHQLADAHFSLGGSHHQSKNFEQALKHHTLSMQMQKKRYSGDSSFAARSEIGHEHIRLGDVWRLGRKPVEAFREYRAAQKICEVLQLRAPTHLRNISLLHFIHRNIGDVHQDLVGDNAAAMKSYEQALQLIEICVRESPSNSDYRMSLINALERVGETRFMLDRYEPAEARKHLDRRMKILRDTLNKDKENRKFRRNIHIGLESIGFIEMVGGDYKEAWQYFEEMIRIRHELLNEVPDNKEFQSDLMDGYAFYYASRYYSGAESTADERFDFEINLNAPPSDAGDLTALQQKYWYKQLRLIAMAAKAVTLAAEWKHEDEAARKARIGRYRDKAIAALKRGIADGLTDFTAIEKDPLLDDIRAMAAYQDITKSVKK